MSFVNLIDIEFNVAVVVGLILDKCLINSDLGYNYFKTIHNDMIAALCSS